MSVVNRLEELLEETGRRHHEAYAETDGDDPDWASWYAAYLVDRLPSIIDVKLDERELAELMEQLGRKQAIEAPETPWPRFYAEFLVQSVRYSPGLTGRLLR